MVSITSACVSTHLLNQQIQENNVPIEHLIGDFKQTKADLWLKVTTGYGYYMCNKHTAAVKQENHSGEKLSDGEK